MKCNEFEIIGKDRDILVPEKGQVNLVMRSRICCATKQADLFALLAFQNLCILETSPRKDPMSERVNISTQLKN